MTKLPDIGKSEKLSPDDYDHPVELPDMGTYLEDTPENFCLAEHPTEETLRCYLEPGHGGDHGLMTMVTWPVTRTPPTYP